MASGVEKLRRKEPPEFKEVAPAAQAKRLRADASRNREKLIAIAAIAFAERGGAASLEDIARQAEVGIGTLYRHFPTREHLVEVVYRREVEALCDAAEELAQNNAPDVALSEWMQRFVDYIAAKRGMAHSLRILFDANSEVFANTSGMVTTALQRLVDAAVADGSIRSDVDISDISQALSGIYSAPDTPDWRDRSRRLVSLLMDGLRWGSAKSKM
ncbi:TetR family transcriptional regulator [Phyllobacterium endophyticum]|nr:TetR family transcriptional regulator [Phyllobacterium endophyticum]